MWQLPSKATSDEWHGGELSPEDDYAKLHHGGRRRWARAAQVGAKGPTGLGLFLGRGNREMVGYNAG
jgi:hypothetical protein